MPPLAYIYSIFTLCCFITVASSQQPPPPDPTQLTANELLSASQSAYDNNRWPQAELLLQTFIDTYGNAPEAAATTPKLRAMLVITQLRQKKYSETIELLESSIENPNLDPIIVDELAFWRGICHLQSDNHDAAIAAFSSYHSGKLPYTSKLPNSHHPIYQSHAIEAILLHAICHVLKEDHQKACEILNSNLEKIRKVNREAAGRATILLLHSLLALEQHNDALQIVQHTFQHLDDISQIVAFQSLCLQLGSNLLENDRFYDAITCLQRLWPKKRLLDHQQQALTHFQSQLKQSQKNPAKSYLVFQYEGLIARIQREITSFEAIPNYDAAVRFRVATAYQALERYREAALILEDMLHHMPADDIVKTASLSLIQCWLQASRWPKAVDAADTYIKKFNDPENTDLPTAYYLRATTLHSAKKPYDAELAFTTVHQKFPNHQLAPRSLFMEGICLLEQDLNQEAIDAFNETSKRFPDSDLVEDAFYWIGMALSFDKQHEAARQHLHDYLNRYPEDARYHADATFRIAHATFSLAEYPQAISQLRQFITQHPDNQFCEEAKLLLGDALAAEGKIDPAITAYLSINNQINLKYYEEAQFRIGNIYKLSEKYDQLRDHFQAFLNQHPLSPRIAEAIYWIGWSHSTSGQPHLARQAYWDTIKKHGPNANSTGIEDILTSLPKLYRDLDDPTQLFNDLDQHLQNAIHPTLQLRITWAKSHALQKTNPDQARQLLINTHPLLKPQIHHPRIIADIAEAFHSADQKEAAQHLYSELRKWHPRAIEKDRAFYGLALLAIEQNQHQQALQHFERFEKETISSSLLHQVHQHKAKLYLNQKNYPQAQQEFEKILELPSAPRHLKAKTLLQLGELHSQLQQDLKATAYFERVYISYSNYTQETAAAYFLRAQALDRLQQPDKAFEVYLELATHPALNSQPQQQQAIQILNQRDPQWQFTKTNQPSDPENPQ